MNQKKSLSRIVELFSKLSTHIDHNVAAGFPDENSIAEEILRPILSIVYKLDDLINLDLSPNPRY